MSNMHLSAVASNWNIPPPSVLRQEAKIQQEVQLRLQDLSEKIQRGNTNIKFQRRGRVEILCKSQNKVAK